MKKYYLASIMLLFLLLIGCSEQKIESKSMEQLYEEKGVPVKVKTIETTTFEKSVNYSGILTGIEQTSVHAAFGDEVEKVHVKVGDYVKKDQLLVSFPTDAPSAQYSQAKAAFESVKTTYDRMKTLLKKGAISQQDFDNVETQYKVSKANWETVRKLVKVKAPFSGYVTKVSVNETDNVRAETELAVISNTDHLKTRIFVTEKDFPLLSVGQRVHGAWNAKKINGKIVQVDMAKDRMKQGFGVMIEFANPENKIPSGVTVEMQIVIENTPDAIVLDKKYILEEDDKRFVFITKKGNAVKVPVILGSRNELQYEVLDGLNRGDNLIIEGHRQVKENQKVNVLNRG